MGHLYKGGVWLKKKTYISGFNANTAPDGIDWRTNAKGDNWLLSQAPISAADANKYFFLPTMGEYGSDGKLYYIGQAGYYWSSSSWGPLHAYCLRFNTNRIYVDGYYDDRNFGNITQPFSYFGDN